MLGSRAHNIFCSRAKIKMTVKPVYLYGQLD